MPHIIRAKSFISDASVKKHNELDIRGNVSLAGEIEDYITDADTGGSSVDIDEVLSVSSCRLGGDRIFTIVVLEDQTAGG